MSLINKKSLYDRNVKGVGEDGPLVGESVPGEGNYFTEQGQSPSPFNRGDQLVSLLEDKVIKSKNSGLTYDPAILQARAPGPPGEDQDFDGIDGGQGYFHGINQPGRFQGKQIGGTDLHEHLLQNSYTYNHGLSNSTTVGPSPSNSDYQDLNIDIRTESPGLYKNNGPADGFY
jgi:hypothetical protein